MPAPADFTPAESSLPTLTAAEVRRLADPGVFTRGEEYQRYGMLSRLVRRGNILGGVSQGSHGERYELRVTFSAGPEKVFLASCDCLYEGFCKHLVALLLTYIDHPEVFEVRPTIDELLAGQDRDGLIAIIREVIERHPEFERALERAAAKTVPVAPVAIAEAGAGDGARVSVVMPPVRTKLHAAMDAFNNPIDDEDEGSWYDHDDDDFDDDDDQGLSYGDADRVVCETVELGERYEAAGRLADAVAIFASVITIGTERYEDLYGTGELIPSFHASGRGLVRCLERQRDLPLEERLTPASRVDLIDGAYELWLFIGDGYWDDLDGENPPPFSAYFPNAHRPEGKDATAALRTELTAEERAALDARWRAEATNSATPPGRALAAMNLGLELNGPEALPVEEMQRLLSAASLWEDQAYLLIALDRVPEALVLAARKITEPQRAIDIAQSAWKSGGAARDAAVRFIDDRLWEAEGKDPNADYVYLTWLARAREQLGQMEQAMDARARLFKIRPDAASYEEVRRFAQGTPERVAHWPETREAMLASLTAKQRVDQVMEIYLREGQVAEAIALLESDTKVERQGLFGSYTGSSPLWRYRERVAAAAGADFPDDAIRLYREVADQQIAYKTRDCYSVAAHHLARVKEVMIAHGRREAWAMSIATLRAQHKNLRALQEELTRAGL